MRSDVLVLMVVSAVLVGGSAGWLMSQPEEGNVSESLSVVENRSIRERKRVEPLPVVIVDFEEKANDLLGQRRMHNQTLEFYLLWAENDPLALIAWAKEANGGKHLNEAWRAWGAVDFVSAWTEASKKTERERVVRGAIESDPKEVFYFLKENFPDSMADGEIEWGIQGSLANWMKREPEAAIAEARNLELSGKYFYRNLLGVWAKTDPDAALSWIDRLKHLELDLKPVVLRAAASVDPDWALAHLEDLNGHRRDIVLNEVVSKIATDDWSRAFELSHQINHGDRKVDAVLNCLASAYLQSEDSALTVFEGLRGKALESWDRGPLDVSDQKLHLFLLDQMLVDKPEIALQLIWESEDLTEEYVSKFPADFLISFVESPYQAEIINEVLKRGDSVAEAYLNELPQGEGREEFLRRMAQKKLNADEFESALRYAERSDSKEVLEKFWDQYTWKNPEEGLARLAVEGNEHIRNGILQGLVNETAAREHYEEAAAMLEQHPHLMQESDALSTLLFGWMEKDAFQASEWISSLPEGEGKSWAVGRLVDDLSDINSKNFDPEGAMYWAVTAPDLDAEDAVLPYELWLHQDEAAARKFAREVEMEDDLRETLLEMP